MTVKEITQLRKSGDIDKAYLESKNLFDSNPDEKYNRIQLAHCIRALMDRAAKTGDASALSLLLQEFASLHLENIGEAELNNQAVWDVRNLLITWRQNEVYDPEALERLFNAFRHIEFARPHRYFSILLDALVRVRDEKGNPWPGIVEFIDWWELKNLLSEDFTKVRIHNGQMIPSLAERAFTAYVKALLALLAEGRMRREAEEFLPELDAMAETHPEFQYALYYKAQILKAIGRNDEALEAARLFVLNRRREFWAWSMLGDMVDDEDLKLSCYCRALSCKADPGFLFKVRRKAAVVMRDRGDYAAARKEYEYILYTCQKKGWNIPPEVMEATQQRWYIETIPEHNNFRYYQEHFDASENFLLGDVPEKAIIIVKYNPQKNTCSFITEDRERGFFSTLKFRENFADNQIYMARIPEKVDEKGFTKIAGLRRVDDVTPYEGVFFRRCAAPLNIRPGQTFTFIDDIYIDGSLLDDIEPGETIDITAVVFYNIKRASWGWRALRVSKA